ncbi:MAG TPA: glycosyltransferase family 4 protein [Candidatus Aquilonibacter sp.]|nr:glycosyltransferase family 4 protein [Candidatus Aquilonibacter sp.]
MAVSQTSGAGYPSVRLAYLVSHPIQYQAPLLRRIAREPGIDLTVFFGSDFSVRGYQDQGFNVEVQWDVPLLDGYRSEFLPRLRDSGTVSPLNPISRGILQRLRMPDGAPAFDALWVHGYASVNALQGIFAASALGIPVLLRAESWLADRPRHPATLAAKELFFRMLRPAIAAALPIGSRNREYWARYFGPDMPQFLMPYAVDNAYFAARAQNADTAKLRAELQLSPNRPVILFASKLQQRKHADHLLEAYHRLCFSSDPGPYLVIVGDGEERQPLETRATELGLDGVRFAGFRNQSELPAFFALAQVFVLPSRHEPWGLIVNEAMACGCCVVVSDDVGAHTDLITNGVEGFVYPTGNIEALTNALRQVLSVPGQARRMGEAARSRIAGWDFEADVRGLRAALAAVTKRLHTDLDSGFGTRKL